MPDFLSELSCIIINIRSMSAVDVGTGGEDEEFLKAESLEAVEAHNIEAARALIHKYQERVR